jgi:hypothetical protein
MGAIQRQAMRHVLCITNAIFFILANSTSLPQTETMNNMESLIMIMSELGENTQPHQLKLNQKRHDLTGYHSLHPLMQSLMAIIQQYSLSANQSN